MGRVQRESVKRGSKKEVQEGSVKGGVYVDKSTNTKRISQDP